MTVKEVHEKVIKAVYWDYEEKIIKEITDLLILFDFV